MAGMGLGGVAAAAAKRRRQRAQSPPPRQPSSGAVGEANFDVDAEQQHHDNNHGTPRHNNHNQVQNGNPNLQLRAPHPHPRVLQPELNPSVRVGFAPLEDEDDDEDGPQYQQHDDFYDADDGTAELGHSSGRPQAKKPKPWYMKHWFPKPLRNVAGRIVENEPFQMGIILLIAINALMLGIGTFDFVEDNPRVQKAFDICDYAFLVIFTVELALQIIYRDWRIFCDGWLTFDFVIILFSWIFSDLQVIRAFRIFRALRLISRVQTLRNLVEALCSVMPKMACIAALLALVFYIFAVMFTGLFRTAFVDGFTSYDYFSTLDASLFTLFQIMTMDNWAEICRECQQQYTWAWMPFTVFVVASGFVVVNLIIAVICDSISSLNEIADGQAASQQPTNAGDDNHVNVTPPPPTAPSPKQMKQEIDDLTVMLEQMQASQYHGRAALEKLTKQLSEAGAVEL